MLFADIWEAESPASVILQFWNDRLTDTAQNNHAFSHISAIMYFRRDKKTLQNTHTVTQTDLNLLSLWAQLFLKASFN